MTRDAGYDFHLTKPVDFVELESLIAVDEPGPQYRGLALRCDTSPRQNFGPSGDRQVSPMATHSLPRSSAP